MTGDAATGAMQVVAARTGKRPVSALAVGGGSINDAWKIKTAQCISFFLKRNNASHFPQLLSSEADGLKLLDEHQLIRTPAVIDQWEQDNAQYLLLEWIEPGEKTAAFWESFGRRLAAVHGVRAAAFGQAADNSTAQHRAQWELANLYPLLIHLYLFGQRYLPAIQETLRRYL